MNYELLYTSAARGLKPGSQGFCTVACTEGIPPALVGFLESLSGYKPINVRGQRLTPVQFSYLTYVVGRRRYAILSRSCASGFDYSQRTNSFSHHVVLDENELPECGPASLLSQPGFMRETWDGVVGLLPARPVIPDRQSADVMGCKAWDEQVGDPGWAGWLAESLLQQGQEPVWLIVRPETWLLPLVCEPLLLLPANRRWDMSFTTCYTELPLGTECRLRIVFHGTMEEKRARTKSTSALLDLTRPLGIAPDAALVQRARRGPVRTEVAASRPAERASQPPMARRRTTSSSDQGDSTRIQPTCPRTRTPIPPPLPLRKPSILALVSMGSLACLMMALVGWYFLAGGKQPVVIDVTPSQTAPLACPRLKNPFSIVMCMALQLVTAQRSPFYCELPAITEGQTIRILTPFRLARGRLTMDLEQMSSRPMWRLSDGYLWMNGTKTQPGGIPNIEVLRNDVVCAEDERGIPRVIVFRKPTLATPILIHPRTALPGIKLNVRADSNHRLCLDNVQLHSKRPGLRFTLMSRTDQETLFSAAKADQGSGPQHLGTVRIVLECNRAGNFLRVTLEATSGDHQLQENMDQPIAEISTARVFFRVGMVEVNEFHIGSP
jgi:hypothetical protein